MEMRIKNGLLALVSFACLGLLPATASATTITEGFFGSTLTGSPEDAPALGSPCSPGFSCQRQTYDTTGNLALGATATVSSVISSPFNLFHGAAGITDGYYGNGSSWIGSTTNSSLTLDLGFVATIDQIIFGRYRMGTCCNDRLAGQFKLEISSDGSIFTDVFGFTTVNYGGGQSVKTDFNAGTPEIVTAQYLKLTFANVGTAIDEVQVYGAQIPEPAALALFGLGLAGLGWSRRKKA